MPHSITRITVKIFRLLFLVAIAISIALPTITYYQAVEQIESFEIAKLEGIAQTASLHIKDMELQDPESFTSEKLKDWVAQMSLRNNSNIAFRLIQVNAETSSVLIISDNSLEPYRGGDETINRVLEERKAADVAHSWVTTEIGEESAFYALRMVDSEQQQSSLFLVLANSIQESTYQERILLGTRILIGFGLIGFLTFFLQRGIVRIFKHEHSTKERVKEYAAILESRNEDLERVSMVLSKSENLIVMTDPKGLIQWVNRRDVYTNNFSAEELQTFVGKELAEVSFYAKINEVIEQVNASKSPIRYECKAFDSEKKAFWFSTTVSPILDSKGNVENIVFVDADITKLKEAQNEISHLANFAEVNTNALIRMSPRGEVLFTNEPGKKVVDFWNLDRRGLAQKSAVLKTLQRTMSLDEEQKVNLEIHQRIYSVKFRPVIEKGFVNIYAEDITEIKQTEKQYKQKALTIEQNNLNITDSINYAKRIQDAILPNEDHLRKYFNDSFLIYKPKDIVSGDFVWMHELEEKKEYLVALADCTGHGVPGAMMSIVGHGLLNDIVVNEGITEPGEILEVLNKELIKTLRQKTDGQSMDGMDVGILKINYEELSATFAGAYQDIYWMNGQLNMIRGDRMPIGGKHHDLDRTFQEHRFTFSKGDSIFLTSDGYVDQFGGPDNKKFMKRRFTRLLSTHSKYSMQAQSHIYQKTFEDWQGTNEQIDDVAMMGIKLV